jgi:hypothetical protein
LEQTTSPIERRPLGADDLADVDRIDRRFLGDAEIEIPRPLGRPVEQQRAKGQLGGGSRGTFLDHYRQAFL